MPTAKGEEEEAAAAAAAESEELEPLFDYSRVQPTIAFCFDDSDLEKSDIFVHCNKRPKVADPVAEADAVEGDKAAAGVKEATVVTLEEEDWLPPPPKPAVRADVRKDKTVQGQRLNKQELGKLAEDATQKVVETVMKDFGAKKPPEQIVLDELPEPQVKNARDKIVIRIQDKDEQQQFRIYKDEKFDKIFKVYTKKVELSPSDLTFVFDGDKINPASTPKDLELEDDDMIEVRHKPKPLQHTVLDEPPEPQVKNVREKIVIRVQDKDGQHQFRIYKNEKFDKLFKVYAKKVKLTPSDLTFVFDGDKINPASTPKDLDMEEDDMIEVCHKPR